MVARRTSVDRPVRGPSHQRLRIARLRRTCTCHLRINVSFCPSRLTAVVCIDDRETRLSFSHMNLCGSKNKKIPKKIEHERRHSLSGNNALKLMRTSPQTLLYVYLADDYARQIKSYTTDLKIQIRPRCRNPGGTSVCARSCEGVAKRVWEMKVAGANNNKISSHIRGASRRTSRATVAFVNRK